MVETLWPIAARSISHHVGLMIVKSTLAPVELVLIRHGRPERIDHDPDGADPGLTELGHRQAAAMARYLEREPISALYVSPQLRAQHTADPLAQRLSLSPSTIHGLAEFDLGHPSYIPGEERAPLTAKELQDLLDVVTSDAFQDRVISTMSSIIDSNPERTVAAVCHGGVISSFMSHLLGTNPTTYYNTEYTSVTRVRASRSGRRSLISFNECHWLRDLC